MLLVQYIACLLKVPFSIAISLGHQPSFFRRVVKNPFSKWVGGKCEAGAHNYLKSEQKFHRFSTTDSGYWTV
jgi:hypothetical protein